MTTINISLPESLKSYIDQQIRLGHYNSVDEYFRELILEDQKRRSKTELENILLAGIASGEATEMTEQDWTSIRSAVQQRSHPSAEEL